MDTSIIREEMDRLDKISGLNTSNIPIRVSTRMTSGWGKCSYRYVHRRYGIKEIVFAARLLEYGTMEHILNVVRHEYAHAYVMLTHNKNHGHDAVWKQAALRFGCNARRCETFDEVDRNYRYKVTCQGCEAVSYYQKKTGIVKKLKEDPNSTECYCKICKGRSFLLEEVSHGAARCPQAWQYEGTKVHRGRT